jgi:hypothetical protein
MSERALTYTGQGCFNGLQQTTSMGASMKE